MGFKKYFTLMIMTISFNGIDAATRARGRTQPQLPPVHKPAPIAAPKPAATQIDLGKLTGDSQMENEYAAPLLSGKKFKLQYKKFTQALAKYKRCILIGPCTHKEMKEVTKTVKRGALVLGSAAAIAAGTALSYYVIAPYVGRKMKEGAKQLGTEMATSASDTLATKYKANEETINQKMGEMGSKMAASATDAVAQKYTKNVDIITTKAQELSKAATQQIVDTVSADLATRMPQIKAAAAEIGKEAVVAAFDEVRKQIEANVAQWKGQLLQHAKLTQGRSIEKLKDDIEQLASGKEELSNIEQEKIDNKRRILERAQQNLQELEQADIRLARLVRDAAAAHLEAFITNEELIKAITNNAREFVKKIEKESATLKAINDVIKGQTKVRFDTERQSRLGVPHAGTFWMEPTGQGSPPEEKKK